MNINVGDRTVVASNTIVAHSATEPIEFGHLDLRFRIDFKLGGTSPEIKTEISGLTLLMSASGFENAFGTAWFSDVGNLADQRLYLALFIQTIGPGPDACRLINFTLSTGAK